jgi:hypothetical protein
MAQSINDYTFINLCIRNVSICRHSMLFLSIACQTNIDTCSHLNLYSHVIDRSFKTSVKSNKKKQPTRLQILHSKYQTTILAQSINDYTFINLAVRVIFQYKRTIRKTGFVIQSNTTASVL